MFGPRVNVFQRITGPGPQHALQDAAGPWARQLQKQYARDSIMKESNLNYRMTSLTPKIPLNLSFWLVRNLSEEGFPSSGNDG